MLAEFDVTHEGWPAKVFESVVEARVFIDGLAELQINHRVLFLTHRKRLKKPVQTIVMLLDELDHGTYH